MASSTSSAALDSLLLSSSLICYSFVAMFFSQWSGYDLIIWSLQASAAAAQALLNMRMTISCVIFVASVSSLHLTLCGRDGHPCFDAFAAVAAMRSMFE